MRPFKSIVVIFTLLIFVSGASIAAEVAPAANQRHSVTIGGLSSLFQPDYAGGNLPKSGPTHLIGVSAYLDVRFTRWVQVEAEARWLPFHTYRDYTEDNYLIGPRIPFYRLGRATPYAKVLLGSGNGDFLHGGAFAIVYGGGLDYSLSRQMNLRVFDFEYQQWHTSPMLFPYGCSAGVGFNF